MGLPLAKFLLVDDSEFIRFDITQILNNLGHEVLSAENGLSGYRLACKHEDFDCILSDFNMPVWDGFTMVEKIREFEHYKSIPVGMLTTETSKNLKARGKELGISVWYIKPLDPKLFEKTIKIVLENNKAI